MIHVQKYVNRTSKIGKKVHGAWANLCLIIGSSCFPLQIFLINTVVTEKNKIKLDDFSTVFPKLWKKNYIPLECRTTSIP